MQKVDKNEDEYFVEFPTDEVGGSDKKPITLQPDDEALITIGVSNLLQLKRPRLTWVEEELHLEVEGASNSKRTKREIENMEWETDESLLEESSYMAEEAGLTMPPMSP